MAGDEDDRNLEIDLGHASLEIEARETGELNVQHKTTRSLRSRAPSRQEVLRSRVSRDAQPRRTHQTSERLTHRCIIVHHEDRRVWLGHRCYERCGTVN